MNTIHRLHLQPLPFSKIVAGTKTIESRLYDAKRRVIQLGDIIEFHNEDQTVQRTVIGLFIYPTFAALMNDRSPQEFGWDTVAEAIAEIEQFYTAEQQEQFGVVGIEIQ